MSELCEISAMFPLWLEEFINWYKSYSY